MSKGIWITEKTLRSAKDAVKSSRIELEGGEPWLDGDDMVSVQRIWERDKLEKYIKHLGDLEDILVGLLAICFPVEDMPDLLAERDALRAALEELLASRETQRRIVLWIERFPHIKTSSIEPKSAARNRFEVWYARATCRVIEAEEQARAALDAAADSGRE